MDDVDFKIKTYGWQELSQLYAPNITPKAACQRFRRWVWGNETLRTKLENLGWTRGRKMLTPIQVQTIVEHLGEP